MVFSNHSSVESPKFSGIVGSKSGRTKSAKASESTGSNGPFDGLQLEKSHPVAGRPFFQKMTYLENTKNMAYKSYIHTCIYIYTKLILVGG